MVRHPHSQPPRLPPIHHAPSHAPLQPRGSPRSPHTIDRPRSPAGASVENRSHGPQPNCCPVESANIRRHAMSWKPCSDSRRPGPYRPAPPAAPRLASCRTAPSTTIYRSLTHHHSTSVTITREQHGPETASRGQRSKDRTHRVKLLDPVPHHKPDVSTPPPITVLPKSQSKPIEHERFTSGVVSP